MEDKHPENYQSIIQPSYSLNKKEAAFQPVENKTGDMSSLVKPAKREYRIKPHTLWDVVVTSKR